MLQIKTLARTYSILAALADTVLTVKRQLQGPTGRLASQMTLTYLGDDMDDEQTIASYYKLPGTLVFLLRWKVDVPRSGS
jgi:hypothetical protein